MQAIQVPWNYHEWTIINTKPMKDGHYSLFLNYSWCSFFAINFWLMVNILTIYHENTIKNSLK